MAWVRIDDHFDEHPKLAKVGPLGWGVWLAGLAYCNRNLTDGFIPHSVAESIGGRWRVWTTGDDGREQVTQIARTTGMRGDDMDTDWVIGLLLDAELWEPVDGGYHVHDYEEYQPTREQVLTERAQTASRVEKWRGRRGNAVTNGVGNGAGNGVTNGVGNGAGNGVTNGGVTPAPNPNPNPNPVPVPEPTGENSPEGGTGETAVRPSAPPVPPAPPATEPSAATEQDGPEPVPFSATDREAETVRSLVAIPGYSLTATDTLAMIREQAALWPRVDQRIEVPKFRAWWVAKDRRAPPKRPNWSLRWANWMHTAGGGRRPQSASGDDAEGRGDAVDVNDYRRRREALTRGDASAAH